MPMIGRRGFITGLVSLIAAPAIVRVASIMPVKVMRPEIDYQSLMAQPFPDEWKIGPRLTMDQWIAKAKLDMREEAFFNAGGWYRPHGMCVDKWLHDMRVRDEALAKYIVYS